MLPYIAYMDPMGYVTSPLVRFRASTIVLPGVHTWPNLDVQGRFSSGSSWADMTTATRRVAIRHLAIPGWVALSSEERTATSPVLLPLCYHP